jgi:hypothetical protein
MWVARKATVRLKFYFSIKLNDFGIDDGKFGATFRSLVSGFRNV